MMIMIAAITMAMICLIRLQITGVKKEINIMRKNRLKGTRRKHKMRTIIKLKERTFKEKKITNTDGNDIESRSRSGRVTRLPW